jgi:hypothetical protein
VVNNKPIAVAIAKRFGNKGVDGLYIFAADSNLQVAGFFL